MRWFPPRLETRHRGWLFSTCTTNTPKARRNVLSQPLGNLLRRKPLKAGQQVLEPHVADRTGGAYKINIRDESAIQTQHQSPAPSISPQSPAPPALHPLRCSPRAAPPAPGPCCCLPFCQIHHAVTHGNAGLGPLTRQPAKGLQRFCSAALIDVGVAINGAHPVGPRRPAGAGLSAQPLGPEVHVKMRRQSGAKDQRRGQPRDTPSQDKDALAVGAAAVGRPVAAPPTFFASAEAGANRLGDGLGRGRRAHGPRGDERGQDAALCEGLRQPRVCRVSAKREGWWDAVATGRSPPGRPAACSTLSPLRPWLESYLWWHPGRRGAGETTDTPPALAPNTAPVP